LSDTALVVFTPSGKRGRFALGTPLLQAARSLGVDLDSVCGGRGLCGRCQVQVGEGEFAKHGIASSSSHVTAAGEVEARYGRRKPLAASRRLGCQALLQGDVVVDVPAESQVHKQVVRKRAEAPGTLLTFIPAAGDFINAELLGTPKQQMIGNVIQAKFLESLDYPTAASLSFVLMALILVGLLVYAKLVGSERLTG
jgi:ferredoxin